MASAASSGIRPHRHAGQCILFVDDEAPMRKLFARAMARHRFAVDVASSAREALHMVQRAPYPVVVTDLRMPGIDGVGLMSHIHTYNPHTTFVLVTGMPPLEQDQTTVEAFAVLTKPWDESHMADTLRRALEHTFSHVHSPKVVSP